ncbi:Stp1/IreP family PP2C-type Ser/Thr phosphatase [Ramlibacter sp. MAHUQ-53]|uniref:Stp1/IreP family PP2C-type Ser/Thr phosphatase n=1 Tax=unclassified Ramlibacter TaxID=2617605 RepID=UPI00363B6D19
MHYAFACLTDRGLTRANNEDAVFVDAAHGLAVLADGMGGYNAGEVASGMATSLLAEHLGRWLEDAGPSPDGRDLRRALQACVAEANRAIFDAAQANAHYAGMGTTLVVAVFQEARVVVGHIGDSRLYRLRGGHLVRITRDHSLLQEQLDAGLITPQQAAVSVHRNLVTRAMGVDEAVLLEVAEHRVEPGDCYLLCSDGLSDMVDDASIATLMAADVSPDARARLLVDAANARGGRDNISVLLAQASGTPAKRGLMSRLLGA